MTKALVDGVVNCGREVPNFSAIWTERVIEENGNEYPIFLAARDITPEAR
jgi:hypothetical protein